MEINKKHDKLILLDFDRTIFHTAAFIDALKNRLLEQFGVSEEVFMQFREEVKNCCRVIDIDTFTDHLDPARKDEMHKAIHEVIQTQSASLIFKDVLPFIERHKEHFDIVITTHGDAELQSEKIEHSKLPSIPHVISLDSKDKAVGSLIKKYHEIHFIDDRAENIDVIKTAYPKVTTYFMKRPEDRPYATQPSECGCADFVIHDLTLTIDNV